MNFNRELRKVPAGFLDPIVVTLDINEDWKRVMALIPKDLQSDHFEPKYNSEHIRLIEQHAHNTKLKCSQVLFDEWGTSGRIRPTLQTLQDILIQAQIYRASEYLASVLKENKPPRPVEGPGAEVDTNVTSLLSESDDTVESVEQEKPTKLMQNNITNGNTNETYENLDNAPTKPMKSDSDFIVFSGNTLNNIPDLKAMSPSSSCQTQTRSSENELPKPEVYYPNLSPSAIYIPAFSQLMPKTVSLDNHTNSSFSGTSTTQSETSRSTSDVTNQSEQLQYSHFQMPSSSLFTQVDSEILENTSLINFKYEELESITRKFSDSHIGSGGFGDVFIGAHGKYGQLAIKRAHSFQLNVASIDMVKIFNAEVKSLSLLRHENIVPILGYSLDGLAPCIVCKYIEGGSLLENIGAKKLNEIQRMNIMIGTAAGLKYIHSTEKPSSVGETQMTSRKAYFLHGDVKSANILITKEYVPKLCDFGLSKQCVTTFHTESIMGTQAYMAPERFSGTITQKGDIFSYGIVLLELLTGLEPIITENNEKVNIKMYVQDNCVDDNITSLLDPLIANWCKAQKIYELAKLCMKTNKNNRPSMATICDTLQKINEYEQKVFYADV